MASLAKSLLQRKNFVLNLVNQKQNFAWVFIIIGIVVIHLLTNKKSVTLKLAKKNSNFTTQFCLANISENFDYVESEEVSFKENVYHSSVEYNAIDKFKFLNINKYLMVKNNRKQRLDLLKKYLLDY